MSCAFSPHDKAAKHSGQDLCSLFKPSHFEIIYCFLPLGLGLDYTPNSLGKVLLIAAYVLKKDGFSLRSVQHKSIIAKFGTLAQFIRVYRHTDVVRIVPPPNANWRATYT
mmetsp:Transcript_33856/g.64520  ORF Transcript_33856/g.64520 Transcript_33856/m.64520 type:complete len:110 (+) Transcript_33856:217-546(+)